jgi:hypothetical protein
LLILLLVFCNQDSKLNILYKNVAGVAVDVFVFFFFFTQGFEETGAYNMLAIMLLPRCKGMQCILKFVGPVQEKAVVVEYDQKVLMPMLHKA